MGASSMSRPQSINYPQGHMENGEKSRLDPDWMRIGVGSTLLTGSLLLLTGKRKAGLLVTAAGTALAMLEHKEVVSEWWDALPGYLDHAQRLLDQAAATIDDLTEKRNKVMSLLGR
jgi:hypothetical protein